MASSPPNTPENDQPGKTRLDRELEEILSRNDNIRHLPPPPKRKRPTPIKAARPESRSGLDLPPQLRKLLGAPIILALVLATVAYLLRELSPLLATLLCLAAVVCIIWPMTRQWRRPASPPESRMWRGQVIEVRPQSTQTSPLDRVRDWWRSRQG